MAIYIIKYIMSANENSDSESSMGKFSARGYQYEPEYSMYLYKLDQHLLEHLYGNVAKIIIIDMNKIMLFHINASAIYQQTCMSSLKQFGSKYFSITIFAYSMNMFLNPNFCFLN